MASSNVTAENMGEFIAPYIDMCWPQNVEDIFSVMSLAQQEIWKSGKFHDSLQWFYCAVRPDRTIVTPHGYNTLIGIDLNGKPIELHDQTFLFHRNGMGDVNRNDGAFLKGAIDLGTSPVLYQPTDQELCKCHRTDTKPKWVYVVSEGCSDSGPPYLKTMVSGMDCKNRFIYTYEKESRNGKITVCQCEQNREDVTEVIHGVRYPIRPTRTTFRNIKFKEVRNIVKEPTDTPVEYWAVDESGFGFLIARLEPYEIRSSYRRYKVQKQCHNKCILGLFKRSNPPDIIDDKQILINSNKAAWLSMCMAMDLKWNKKKLQESIGYEQDALKSLNSELREEQSNHLVPPQIENRMGMGRNLFPKM